MKTPRRGQRPRRVNVKQEEAGAASRRQSQGGSHTGEAPTVRRAGETSRPPPWQGQQGGAGKRPGRNWAAVASAQRRPSAPGSFEGGESPLGGGSEGGAPAPASPADTQRRRGQSPSAARTQAPGALTRGNCAEEEAAPGSPGPQSRTPDLPDSAHGSPTHARGPAPPPLPPRGPHCL